MLCDPGSSTYSAQYFSKLERYTFFHTSSRGHSVPIIDGQYQQTGCQYSGYAEYTEGVFTVEFSRAYGIKALTGLTRNFAFTDNSVTVTDTFAFDGDTLPITERFVSRLPVKITGDAVETGGLILRTTDADDVSVTQEEGFWCIDYTVTKDARKFTLEILA